MGLVLGPILFLGIMAVPFGDRGETHRLAAVACLMATWWITEAIPIAATALLPLVLFPFLGILNSNDTARQYANSSIFLFTGGFILALGIEKWGLHRRIAMRIVLAVGEGPKRLVLGFMIASAFLSMWISNTATAMMMLPIGMSVTGLAGERAKGSRAGVAAFSAALMLAIAYGSNLGGVATLIGTPPNIVFQEVFSIEFPRGPEITFFQWIQIGLPVSLLFLAITWFVLTHIVFRFGKDWSMGGREIIEEERRSLGPMTKAEKRVGIVMLITALLWVWQRDMDLGFMTITGWSTLLEKIPWIHITDPATGKSLLHDATVAMAAAIALFLIPAGDRSGRRLMTWETAEKIPFGILFLFGGGFALAKGFEVSGLSQWLCDRFSESPIAQSNPFVLVGGLAAGMTFLTELTSNTATTNMVLPLLASVSRAGSTVNPLLLMIPATLSASFAFMLPVATPPNAIVFGSGQVRIIDMVRAGLVLNVIGIIIVLAVACPILLFIFGVSPQPLPTEWLAP